MKHLIWFLLRRFFSSKKGHFLVILQNDNELRSTGGYITSVFDFNIGRLRAKKRVLSVENDLIKHKEVKAPKVIQDMLFDGHLKTWTFRDGNYSPNFGKTAEQLIDFYHLTFPNQSVPGLLALNYSFIEGWLKALGTIKLDEKNTVDYQSLFTFISAQTSDIDRHDLEVLNQRKSILNLLAKKLLIKTLLRPWTWPKLLLLTKKGFNHKELQFYDKDQKSSHGFEASENEDFLAVIENNYLGLKTNRYLLRTVSHHSRVTNEGSLLNTVKVRWEHYGGNDYPLSGNYRAHVRFYIQKEASFEADETCDSYEEEGFKVIDTKLLLKPQTTLEKVFRYTIPKNFVKNDYRFHYFKQAGVKNESLRKSVSLPQRLKFKKASPTPFKEGLAFKSYENVLGDVIFKADIESSQAHPRVYSHVIAGPQEILVKFNEPVAFNENGKVVEIYEKNKPENSIKIKTLSLINEDRWLLIETEDLPRKNEAFYNLELHNICNSNEIKVQPCPKKLTVVYRSSHFDKWQRQLTRIKNNKKITKGFTAKSNVEKLSDFKSNFDKNSCYPAGHYYSPIVSVEDIKKRSKTIWKNLNRDGLDGIDLNTEGQKKLVKTLSSYYEEMPFKENRLENLRYYLKNPWYAYSDGILLYGMMRHIKPKHVIEVGSGFSSALMLDVNERFPSNQTQLIFIEPYPERLASFMSEKDKKSSVVIQKGLQEIPIKVFNELEPGDILFIDSTHVMKCGSDVQYLLFEILPALKKGVIIHFHDIFYPFEYPKKWVFEGRNWNEDYFLRAFLMYNPEFKILLFSHYLHLHHGDIFEQMPLAYKNSGGSLWIEKQ